jgi:hypothetical protein
VLAWRRVECMDAQLARGWSLSHLTIIRRFMRCQGSRPEPNIQRGDVLPVTWNRALILTSAWLGLARTATVAHACKCDIAYWELELHLRRGDREPAGPAVDPRAHKPKGKAKAEEPGRGTRLTPASLRSDHFAAGDHDERYG